MSNSAKYYLSSQAILPPLTNAASSVLAILRACLITGAGVANVQTLTVAGGIATAVFAAEHSFLPWQVVELAGATPTALNAEARVASVPDAWTITFATTAADGLATGTITCKLAPAGFEEVFTGTNLAVFKPTDPEASGMYFRVSDPSGRSARVNGYETMTAVSTGTGPIPTAAQMSGGLHWYKSLSTDGTQRPWALVVDSRGIFFFSDVDSSGYMLPFYAGDFASFKAGDAWGWLVSGYRDAVTGFSFGIGNIAQHQPADTMNTVYLARAVSGAGGSKAVSASAEAFNAGAFHKWSGDGGGGASLASVYPNPANNGLLLTRAEIIEDNAPRGLVPGLLVARQNVAASFQTGEIVDSSAGLPGRKLLAIRLGCMSIGTIGLAFFDITDTWSR